MPSWVHVDNLSLLFLSVCPEPGLLALLEQLVRILRLQGVQHCEEILTAALPALRVCIGEVLGHVPHLETGLVKLSDGDLVVVRRVAHPGLGHSQQPLLTLEYLLEVVGGNHLLAGHEVLAIGM